MLRRNAFAMAVLLASAGMALAGPQYVDETGYALSGYDPVAYLSLPQAPLGQKQPEAVPGRADITAEWNGATWAFASAANRDRFLADPEAYAPAYDGHCAYGVAQDAKVPANPNLWRIVDGRLYVNITPEVEGYWDADVAGNIEAAESYWPGLEDEDASSESWIALHENDGTYKALGPIAR